MVMWGLRGGVDFARRSVICGTRSVKRREFVRLVMMVSRLISALLKRLRMDKGLCWVIEV